MAYEGELVKTENGRWARFQRCRIVDSERQDCDEYGILVAVELEERFQELLDAAERSIEPYRQRGIPVQVHLDPAGEGLSITFERFEDAVVH